MNTGFGAIPLWRVDKPERHDANMRLGDNARFLRNEVA
jgi:hypothetical protein